MTNTNGITYTLNREQCKQLAAIKHAATPAKDGRARLATIRLRYDADELEVMATNSYMVAWRTFATGSTDDVLKVTAGSGSGTVSVDATSLADAITAAAKLSLMVLVALSSEHVIVSTSSSSITIETKADGEGFPESVDNIISDNAPSTNGEYVGKLPVFSPMYLTLLIKSTGHTLSKCPALRWRVTDKHAEGDPHLKPSRLELLGGGSSQWDALLMPVRT